MENWAGHYLEASSAMKALGEVAEDRKYTEAFALAEKIVSDIQNVKACLDAQQRSEHTEPATAASSSSTSPSSSSEGGVAPTAAARHLDEWLDDERFPYG